MPLLLKSLGTWVSQETSVLFLVKVGIRAEAKAKEFAADVIKLLQPMPFGVIWKLSWIASEVVLSVTDLVKSLIFQALRHDPTLLHSHPDDLNVTKFQASHSDSEWISLLSKMFSRLSKCFIIVEAEDIFRAHRNKPEWAMQFITIFQNLVDEAESSGRHLKILVVGYSNTFAVPTVPSRKNRIVASIQRENPAPPHMRRQFARKNGRSASGWQTLKPRI